MIGTAKAGKPLQVAKLQVKAVRRGELPHEDYHTAGE
jgi:hypothetical protein